MLIEKLLHESQRWHALYATNPASAIALLIAISIMTAVVGGSIAGLLSRVTYTCILRRWLPVLLVAVGLAAFASPVSAQSIADVNRARYAAQYGAPPWSVHHDPLQMQYKHCGQACELIAIQNKIGGAFGLPEFGRYETHANYVPSAYVPSRAEAASYAANAAAYEQALRQQPVVTYGVAQPPAPQYQAQPAPVVPQYQPVPAEPQHRSQPAQPVQPAPPVPQPQPQAQQAPGRGALVQQHQSQPVQPAPVELPPIIVNITMPEPPQYQPQRLAMADEVAIDEAEPANEFIDAPSEATGIAAWFRWLAGFCGTIVLVLLLLGIVTIGVYGTSKLRNGPPSSEERQARREARLAAAGGA